MCKHKLQYSKAQRFTPFKAHLNLFGGTICTCANICFNIARPKRLLHLKHSLNRWEGRPVPVQTQVEETHKALKALKGGNCTAQNNSFNTARLRHPKYIGGRGNLYLSLLLVLNN